MSKLPQEFTETSLENEEKFTYLDGYEMFEDIRRCRRVTGWDVRLIPDKDNLIFRLVERPREDDTPAKEVEFRIKAAVILRDFWPSRYPHDPNVTRYRQWLTTPGGPWKIEQSLNETRKVEQAEAPSRLARLLDDDDDLE